MIINKPSRKNDYSKKLNCEKIEIYLFSYYTAMILDWIITNLNAFEKSE